MGLRVPYYIFMYDVVLFLALGYIWWFFLKRWNRYVAELRPFVRNASIFLGFSVLGRFVDLVTDFWSIPYQSEVLSVLYGISIVGVIYTMINYVLTLEKLYIPPANSGKQLSGEMGDAYVMPGGRKRIGDVLKIIEEFKVPSLIFTRSPQAYEPVKGFAVTVWVTQATDRGVPPTKLHVIQDMAVRFARERRNALVVIDCLEYLLMYNDFPSVFKFLVSLKDGLMLLEATLIVLVDEEVVGAKNYQLLLREFRVL